MLDGRAKYKRETLNNSSKITDLRMEVIFDEYDMRSRGDTVIDLIISTAQV